MACRCRARRSTKCTVKSYGPKTKLNQGNVMDGPTTINKSNRTLRREERRERELELVSDMEIIDHQLRVTQNPAAREGLQLLLDQLYDAYCIVVASEV